MTAKQTVMAASLVVLLAASPVFAQADPDAPPQPAGEVRAEEPEPQPEPAPTPPPPPVEPRPSPPDVPARVPTGTFTLGVGFSPDEHFIATGSVAQDDLFGTGKHLSLTARLSERRELFLIRFEDPAVLGSQLRLRTDLYRDSKRFVGFTRDASGGALTLSRPIAPHLHAFVGYRLERIEVEPDVVLLARGVPSGPPPGPARLGALRAGLSYSTLDGTWLPRRGTSAGGSIEVADRVLGSEIQLVRTDAWLSHHRPLGPLTLHLGATVSSVSGGAPMSERLHFDGASDLRGYAPGALGPSHPLTGMSLGGNYKYTARAELEVPLIPRLGISAAAFVDVGGIHAPTGGRSGASVGVGLIWRSPIGPLRFDWAVPLEGGRPVFLFGLGGSF
ncbi:MAG: BamA/TamA family outer membrane protein [Myxococcota bacterium]|nr:BamA/TamA family outer membrane protein [Myxococcota bacterium]